MATTSPRAQGKRWLFLKKDAQVFTVYHHNKDVILTSRMTHPGFIVSAKRASGEDSKIVFTYSKHKKVKLDLKYFTPCDDRTKALYQVISDTNKFLLKAKELYGIAIESLPDETNSESFSKRRESTSPPTPPLAKRATTSEHEQPAEVQDRSAPNACADETSTTAFSDEMLSYLINKDLVPVKVVVTSLREPRSEYLLREIDEVFVMGLKNEFRNNKAPFVKPLTAVVTGLKSVADFDPRIVDSCQLEIIGGNHRRAALQELYNETKDEQFGWANVLLFCEMPKSVVLKLAARDNRLDSFCHTMTTQDKVKLCQKIRIDDFKGEKTGKWRSHCIDVLGTNKESMEFVFLLSGLEDDSFGVLLEIFKQFDLQQLKGQVTSTKQTANLLSGVAQKPNLIGSRFKCIRGLPNEILKELLTSVQKTEISFKEMKEQAEEWKNMNCLKMEFTKLVGVKSWSDVEERFPLWSSMEKIKAFSKEVKNGKAPERFKSYVQRCLACEDSASDTSTIGAVVTKNGLQYAVRVSSDWKISSSTFETMKFNGADLVILQDTEDWTDDIVSSTTRAVISINARFKMKDYVVVVRKQEVDECTPDMVKQKLYAVFPKTMIKQGATLTTATEIINVIFIGKPVVRSLDFIIGDSEEMLMSKILSNFLPVHGTVLEIGGSRETMDLLVACHHHKANIVGIYQDNDRKHQFLEKAKMLLEDEE